MEWDVSLLTDARSDTNDVCAIELFSLSARNPSRDGNGNNPAPALHRDRNSIESVDIWHVDDIVALRHHATERYLTGRPDLVAVEQSCRNGTL